MTALLLAILMSTVPGPYRATRTWNYVAVGDSAWYSIRTANARVGRARGPMLRFQTLGPCRVVITREAP
jgi:hypothetical protein